MFNTHVIVYALKKMSYAITFDISQLSSQTIFALLLFLAFLCFRFNISPFPFCQAFVVVYIIYLFFHILFIIYLLYVLFMCSLLHFVSTSIFHMICVILCTICIFTYTTTTIPNLTTYYHSNTH